MTNSEAASWDADTQAAADAMIAVGNFFHARGWVPATGGNFSVRLSAERMLITASGGHKGELAREGFLLADLNGKPLDAARKASFETLLHTQIYRFDAAARCVLHVHSVANTVLSRRRSMLQLKNYELLKLLPGISEPSTLVELPIFGNDQNIARLSEQVDAYMCAHPPIPAYLIAGHGLYVWGADVTTTRHRVEALEFIFACELQEERALLGEGQ